MPTICEFCGEIQKSKGQKTHMFTCINCRENIRIDNALRDVIFHSCGDRLYRTRPRYDLYYSPFRSERSASFVVWDDRCHDYGGHLINNKEYGDVFDFVMEYYGITDFQEAARYLNGQLSVEVPKRTYTEIEPQRLLTISDIERLHENVADALEWFENRGVSRFTAYEKKLGMVNSWPSSYTFRGGARKGQEIVFHTRRYAIPNIANGEVMYCKLRLDDALADKQWQALPESLIEEVRHDIAAHKSAISGETVSPDDISDSEIRRRLLGDRFSQLPGPKDANATFNQDRFKRLTTAGVEYLPYDIGLIHEGEIKAMTMEDCTGDPEYGFPSVSSKGGSNIAELMQKVNRIYIIADSDEAGREYALKNQALLPQAQIITPPDGFKAADDVVLAGQALEWMASYGIEPVRLWRRPV